jgi:hypothetical protein
MTLVASAPMCCFARRSILPGRQIALLGVNGLGAIQSAVVLSTSFAFGLETTESHEARWRVTHHPGRFDYGR